MEGRGGRVGPDGEGSKNSECIQSCTTRNTTLSEVPVVLLVTTTLLCRLHQLVREEGGSIFVDVRTAAENSDWGGRGGKANESRGTRGRNELNEANRYFVSFSPYILSRFSSHGGEINRWEMKRDFLSRSSVSRRAGSRVWFYVHGWISPDCVGGGSPSAKKLGFFCLTAARGDWLKINGRQGDVKYFPCGK